MNQNTNTTVQVVKHMLAKKVSIVSNAIGNKFFLNN